MVNLLVGVDWVLNPGLWYNNHRLYLAYLEETFKIHLFVTYVILA